MHNIGFFEDMRYVHILQLIWLIIHTDTDTYVHFFSISNCRDHQVSSVVNLQTVLLCALLLCWPASKSRHKIRGLKLCKVHSFSKIRKHLKLRYVKHVIFIYD